MSSAMSKPILDADTILKRAAPVTGQHAHGIQPFGHLVRMPIALSEHACKESVDNLNHESYRDLRRAVSVSQATAAC